MSTSRTNTGLRPTAGIMSPEERRELQQNIKYFITNKEASALSSREKLEFARLQAKLLPELARFRYPEAIASTQVPNEATIQESQSRSIPLPARTITNGSTQHTRLATTGPAPSSLSKQQKASTPQPKRVPAAKRDPQPSSQRLNLTQESHSRPIKTISGQKRPKLDVYQDIGTAPKRTKLKRRDNGGESDKENRNPLDPIAVKKKKKALGENTNIANNVPVKSQLVPKDQQLKNAPTKPSTQKSAENIMNPKTNTTKPTTNVFKPTSAKDNNAKPVATKIPTAPSAKVPRSLVQPKAAHPSTATRLSSGKDTTDACNPRLPAGQAVNEGVAVSAVPALTPVPVKESVHQDDQTKHRKSGDIRLLSTQDDVPTQARTAPIVPNDVIEIPASVEDDESASPGSIQTRELAPSGTDAQNTEIVQGSQGSQLSQGSQNWQGSLEATFPMPDFLLCEPAEKDRKKEEVKSVALALHQLYHPATPAQSTTLVDGVWCIDDFQDGVSSTVCGHISDLLAVVTTNHIQFWRLDCAVDQGTSQWRRHIQAVKTTSNPIEILFEPSDSFAVLLDPKAQRYDYVSLESVTEPQIQQSIVWTGPSPLPGSKGFIVNPSDGHENGTGLFERHIILAANRPGMILLVPIPNITIASKALHSPVEARTLICSAASACASSVMLIRNTHLIIATFGSLIAVWDLKTASKEPMTVIDTATVLLAPPLSWPYSGSSVVSASVPSQFFHEYRDAIESGELKAFQWPILAVLKSRADYSGTDYESDSQKCALYAIKGDKMQLVHTYQGSGPIMSASCSSRFMACRTRHEGKESLCLWDICKPEAALELSLLESSRPSDEAHEYIPSSQPLEDDVEDEESEDKDDRDSSEIFSCVSTLSPPPELLSSSPFLGAHESFAEPQVLSELEQLPLPEPVPVPVELTPQPLRNPRDWISLMSASGWGAQKVQFELQCEQRWIVVVQQGTLKGQSAVVHIVDFASVLPPL